MSERRMTFDLDDGVECHGVLREISGAPCVVFVHGLTGHMHEHHYHLAARLFEEAGYSTVRFNLYDDEPNTRTLLDCTLKTHADDTSAVVRQLPSLIGDVPLILVGHSFGGPTVLLADKSGVVALALWDSAHPVRFFMVRGAVFDDRLNAHRTTGAVSMMIPDALVTDFTSRTVAELTQGWKGPTLVIASDDPERIASAQEYRDALTGPVTFSTIENSNHTFDSEKAETELCQETLAWLNSLSIR